MSGAYYIRDAVVGDKDVIVAFTLGEAREAEGLDANVVDVERGVVAAFDALPRSRYWVAERGGTPVASISVVKEWSNFRGGDYWWIQSLYIVPEHRGTGLVTQLIDHVVQVAQSERALDLRLYAHSSNERAVSAYRRCGFSSAPYTIWTRRL